MVNEIRLTQFKAAETAINNHQGAVPAAIDPPASKMLSERKHHPSPGDWIGLERILPFEDYGLQNSVSPSAPGHPLSELNIAIPTKWVGKYVPLTTTHQDLYLPRTLPATKGATNVPDFAIPHCMFDHLVERDLFLKALDDRIGEAAKSGGPSQSLSGARTLLQAVAAVSSWRESENGIYAYFAAFCMAVVPLMRQTVLRFFTRHVFHVMCGTSYA